ncbi:MULTISPECIES: cytochrome P460 family protein [unclassified Meiothermus]|uniref:cytochrome P460 family protein n=1 Tax=unclassified Meiothermus TaxID=370471 RepID=UPI000D7C147C|nr:MULTISPECIES: cytochrome P460 family protein [unclassified Meiothermus]PZA07653.1 hypothetical protein DNA98_04870 [Meiothermus sp. Pnk-1]RYM36534.1 hypothetical protein EWH23_09770 [Meiothermus sp. PNK-Is4]
MLGLAVLVGGLLAGMAQEAGLGDYKTRLVHYATVDRVDGFIRDIYISPQALSAVRQQKPLPPGTLVLVDLHRAKPDGRGGFVREGGLLVRVSDEPYVHVMIRQEGEGSSSWRFAALEPRTGAPEPGVELPGDCLECHRAALASEMLFSYPQLLEFSRSGKVQHSFCNQPGRQLC